MNNLAACSKILYDREVIRLTQENELLKKQLDEYIFPRNIFKSEEDKKEKLSKFINKMEKKIYSIPVLDIKPACFPTGVIYTYFQEHLTQITQNRNSVWIDKKTKEIFDGIRNLFYSFEFMGAHLYFGMYNHFLPKWITLIIKSEIFVLFSKSSLPHTN